MTDAVEQARADVARDLGVDPHHPVIETAAQHRAWWLAQWPDGAPHVLGLLAQDVQEAVNERDPVWPVCTEPTCPAKGGHALYVEPDLGPDPFWTCHRTGLPVAAVGSLPHPA